MGGGSILPVTYYNNKLYFLFGKERDIDENPGWSDFGGGQDANESLFETAMREGSEEMTGFLGDKGEIKKMVNRYGYIKVDYTSDRGIYRCHLFPLKYDEMLIKYYNNNQLFLQKKLDKKVIKNTKIFEKTEIRWFTVNELTKMKKEFRSFYQNIIDLLLDKNQLKEITILAKKIKNVHTKTKKK